MKQARWIVRRSIVDHDIAWIELSGRKMRQVNGLRTGRQQILQARQLRKYPGGLVIAQRRLPGMFGRYRHKVVLCQIVRTLTI